MTPAELTVRIEVLRAENRQLRTDIAAEQAKIDAKRNYYAEHGVYTFKGKANWKRDKAPAWPCGCKPYHDVLTPGRWTALGYRILTGERADDDHRAGRSGRVPIFCRCQVQNENGSTAAPMPEGYDGTPEPIDEIPF